MGLIQSAIFMGQTLGPTIGGILGSAIGFRASFFATASINVLAGTLAVLYVKEQPLERAGRRGGRGRGGLRELLRSRPLAILFVTFFLISVGNMLSRPILPLLLQEIDPEHDVAFTAGLAFSVLGVSGAISSVVSSRGGDRIGLRTMVFGAAIAGAVSTYVVGLGGLADDGAGMPFRHGAGAGCAGLVVDDADQPVRTVGQARHGLRRADIGTITGSGGWPDLRRSARIVRRSSGRRSSRLASCWRSPG